MTSDLRCQGSSARQYAVVRNSFAESLSAFKMDKQTGDEWLAQYADLALYIRLLDAADEGAEWTEVVRVLFGLDPNRNGERARRIHDSHLARARWMTEHGYRDLLRSAMH
jgi:Uncharacterized conserved protein (DUF2285)